MNQNRKMRKNVILAVICLSPVLLLFSAENTQMLTLHECMREALRNNPSVLASAVTVEEIRARADEAKAGFYPDLSLNASSARTYSDAYNSGGYRDVWNSGISAQYTLFRGFRTKASVKAAEENIYAAVAQNQADTHEIIVRVTEAYYRLLQAQRLVEVAEQSVKRAEMYSEFANARFKAGLASRSDILKASVEKSNAQLGLISARNTLLSARGYLNIQMGRQVHSALNIIDDLESDRNFAENSNITISGFEIILQKARENRPELQKMERQIEAQKAHIQFAHGAYYPTIALEGTHRYSGDYLSKPDRYSILGLSISMPVFSGFAVSSRVQQENSAMNYMIIQQKNLIQQISLEVWNAFLDVKKAFEQIESALIFLENADENRRIAEGEYKEGVGSMLDLTDAQTAHVNARQAYIAALANYQIARVILNRAAGMTNTMEMTE